MSELYTRASQLATEKAEAARKKAAKQQHNNAEQMREQRIREQLSIERINEFVQILREQNIATTPLHATTPYYGGIAIGQTSKLCFVDDGWVISEPRIDRDTQSELPGIILHQNATVCNEFSYNDEGLAIAATYGTRIGWDETPPDVCYVNPDATVASGYFGTDDAIDKLANALVRYGVI